MLDLLIFGTFLAYNSHCYTDEPITKLDDISYISLHVYFPIHLDLVFSNLVKEIVIF